MDFYYAMTDENGMLCVDMLHPDGAEDGAWTEDDVAKIADNYRNVIYFGVDNRVPEFRVQ